MVLMEYLLWLLTGLFDKKNSRDQLHALFNRLGLVWAEEEVVTPADGIWVHQKSAARNGQLW